MNPAAPDYLTVTSLEACFEFVAYSSPAGGARTLLSKPGQVERDARGRAQLLHFAPRRLLVPTPTASVKNELLDFEARGVGVLVDVEGRWRSLHVEGPPAWHLLASTIDIDSVLRDRGCAAVPLFDCPSIVAREGSAFDLWITSSYLEGFLAHARPFGSG